MRAELSEWVKDGGTGSFAGRLMLYPYLLLRTDLTPPTICLGGWASRLTADKARHTTFLRHGWAAKRLQHAQTHTGLSSCCTCITDCLSTCLHRALLRSGLRFRAGSPSRTISTCTCRCALVAPEFARAPCITYLGHVSCMCCKGGITRSYIVVRTSSSYCRLALYASNRLSLGG